ncbi:MAG: hypothetical protein KF901_04270 [Myxococcales bacterium]|nr:hypothetical protein [Myxococcales bacterium]
MSLKTSAVQAALRGGARPSIPPPLAKPLRADDKDARPGPTLAKPLRAHDEEARPEPPLAKSLHGDAEEARPEALAKSLHGDAGETRPEPKREEPKRAATPPQATSATEHERTTSASLGPAALLARVRALEEDVAGLAAKTAAPGAHEALARLVALEPLLRGLDQVPERLRSVESRVQDAERLARLEGEGQAVDPRVDALFERLATLEATQVAATARLEALEDVARASAARLAALGGTELGSKLRALDTFDARLAALESDTSRGAADLDVPDLESRLARLESASSEALEERLRALERASEGALAPRVAAVEARLVSLVARFADIAARAGVPMSMPPPPPPPTAHESSAAPSVVSREALSAQLEDLEARLAERVRGWVHDELARARPASKAGAAAGVDDPVERLRSVKGIGPAFARRLVEEGVASAADLAALDDAASAALAERLGVGPGRVRKWIVAARAAID